MLEQVFEFADTGLVAALVFLGRVVPAVLLQVPLFAGQFDGPGDLRRVTSSRSVSSSASRSGVLGQPSDLLLTHVITRYRYGGPPATPGLA